jgi:fibronectin-binding autotransporter adhesin
MLTISKIKHHYLLLLALLISSVNILNAQGVFTSKATANWSTGTTTAFNLTSGSDADGIPDADDDVIIASGHTITVNGAYFCNTLVINAASATTGVTIGANSLNVGAGAGAVTINSPSAAFTAQISLSTGSLTCGNITIGGGAANYIGQITMSGAATVTCTGVTFTGTAAQARFVMAASSQLKIATGTLGTGGTFTCSTGTVEFTTLTGGQTVNAYTYYNLKFSNTSGTNTAAGNITLNSLGTLTTTAGGTFDLSSYTLSVGATFTSSGTGTLKTSNTSAAPITTGKTWAGTVEYAVTTGGQTIMAGTYNNLTLSNSSGSNTTSASTVTVNGTFTTTSGGTFAPGFNVALNGTTSCSQGIVAATAGTITYGSSTGGQNILAGTYVSMTQSNTSGTNTACGNIVMTGTLTTSSGGTFDLSTYTLSGALTPANSGTIKTSNTSSTPLTTGKTWTGTVEYAASADQTIMAGTYTGLTTSGSGTKTVSGNIVLAATATLSIGSSTTIDLTANYTLSGAATSLTVSGSGNLKTSVLTATSATPIITNKTWTGITVIYASTSGSQTVMRGTYTNLTLLNSSGTNTTSASTVTVNGIFTTTSGGSFAPGFDVALNGTTSCSQATISATAGTITYGNSSGGQNILAGTYVSMTQSNTSGINTACGNIVMTGTLTTSSGGTFDLSTYTLSGALTPANSGTIKTSNTSSTPLTTGKTWTGIVEYAASADQTIMAGTYTGLTTSGSGTKTVSGNIVLAATATLSIGSSTTIDLTANYTLSGAATSLTVSGSGNLKTSVLTATSATPIITNKTWTGITVIYASTSGSQTVMRGTYTNLTLLNSSGTNTLSASTVTVNGTFTTTSGGIIQTAALSLTLNGTVACGATIASSGNSTVTYGLSTGSQYILEGTYYNLIQSNTSGTNTACGNIVMTGTLTTSSGGTFDLSTYTLSGALTPANSGIIKTSNTSAAPITTGKTWTGTIEYASASSQTLMAGTYNNLTISGGGNKTMSGAVIVGASGILTLTSGLVTPSGNTLTINNTATTAISGGSSSSYVSGSIIWKINTTTGSFIFPVGISGNYYPLTLTDPTRGSSGQTITVTAVASNPGGSNGSCVSSLSSSEYWSITATGANLSGANISVARTAALGSLTGIGQASTSNGSYASLAGTVSGTNINTSNTITTIASGGTNYFAMVQVSSTAPTITSPTSASASTTTVTLGGNITSIGCANVTERGIYYSTSNGFADGAGTKVSATSSSFSTGVFTISVSSLTPSTTYYYKAFATSTNGTVYTSQGSFSTTAQSFPVADSYESDASFPSSAGSATEGTWVTNSGGGSCGSYRAQLPVSSTTKWLFTPTFYATSGKIYTLSYTGKYTTNTSAMSIYVATSQSSSSITGSDLYIGASDNGSWVSASANTWQCTTSGTYCFAFSVTTGATYTCQLDCISIAETTPATITWDGSSSTSWSTAANWDLNRVPISTDIIVIPNGLVNYPSTMTAGSYNSLSINSTSSGTISIGASTFSGDVTILSANAGNTVEFAGTTTIGGNLTVGTSGSNFNFTVNGTTTVTGNFTLGAASTAVTTNLNYPITATGSFTMGNNSSHITNIAYANSSTRAITASNAGSYTFYGTVNYTATSGDQIVMKSQYNGAVTASGAGKRFMEGNLDINSSLTMSAGNWYCGSSETITVGTGAGADANLQDEYSPFQGGHKSARWQMFLQASEMSTMSVNDIISSISLYVVTKRSSSAFQAFTVKLGHTSSTEFVNSVPSFFLNDATTTVYGPVSYTTTTGWNTFYFDTPFIWDGSSNVLVDISFYNTSPDATSGGIDAISYTTGAFGDDAIIRTEGNTSQVAATDGIDADSRPYTLFNAADGPYNINITNDWLNSGANFYHLQNTVTFDGSSNQAVTTNGDYFYNFVVNNTSGTTALTLADDCNIEGTGTLTDGVITTGANRLISLSTTAANLTGYSNASYVYGNLRRYIATNTSTYGFPLGKGTSTSTYFLSEVINNSLTGVTYLDGKFVSGTPAEYSQANFTALAKQMTGAGVTTKTLYTLDGEGYTQLDPNSQPGGGNYSIRLYNTNYSLSDWTDNGQCIMKRTSGSATLNDYNMAGTINADSGLGRMVADGYLLSTGLTSFSEFIPALEDATPLPIKLLSFEAIKNNKRVKLDWSTASETNNDYFTIERSVNGKDFTDLLIKKGNGNTSHTSHYNAFDSNPLIGLSYYRLKQTDIDGKYTYSPIRSVLFENKEQQTFEVYPNPVLDNRFKVNFTSSNEESILVTIYNAVGQKMYQQEIKVYKGINEIPLQLENQASGTYLIELWNERIGSIQKNIQF